MSGVFLISNYIDLLTSSVDRNISFIVITKLSFAKLPYMLHESIPFLIFIAAVLVFTRISRGNEYTIIQASGISVWQFLLPYMIVAFVVGVLFIAVLNPLSTALMGYDRKISNQYYSTTGSASILSFSGSGLWFIDKLQLLDQEKRVVHAKYLNAKKGLLLDVSFIILDKNFNFIERIDAKEALLIKDAWLLDTVMIYKAYKLGYKLDSLELPTLFKKYDLQNSFIDPQFISIWRLAYFISIIRNTGFSTLHHAAYLYKLLARPFIMSGLILIAASFTLESARFISSPRVIFYSLGVGSILFFFIELIAILGAHGSLPNYLAVIASVVIIQFIGVGLVLHLKDG